MLVDSGRTVGVDDRTIELTLTVDTGIGGGSGNGLMIGAAIGGRLIAGGIISGKVGVDRGETTGDCH